jgi:hypothetical protein
MQVALKTKHFELIQYKFFAKWFLKMGPLPCSPFFQNLKFLYDLGLHQVHPMKMYFIERDMFLLYKFFEINYMTLCIPFGFYFFSNVV